MRTWDYWRGATKDKKTHTESLYYFSIFLLFDMMERAFVFLTPQRARRSDRKPHPYIQSSPQNGPPLHWALSAPDDPEMTSKDVPGGSRPKIDFGQSEDILLLQVPCPTWYTLSWPESLGEAHLVSHNRQLVFAKWFFNNKGCATKPCVVQNWLLVVLVNFFTLSLSLSPQVARSILGGIPMICRLTTLEMKTTLPRFSSEITCSLWRMCFMWIKRFCVIRPRIRTVDRFEFGRSILIVNNEFHFVPRACTDHTMEKRYDVMNYLSRKNGSSQSDVIFFMTACLSEIRAIIKHHNIYSGAHKGLLNHKSLQHTVGSAY